MHKMLNKFCNCKFKLINVSKNLIMNFIIWNIGRFSEVTDKTAIIHVSKSYTFITSPRV